MNVEQYRIEIQRTWQTDLPLREQICNAALGLVGEAVEFHAGYEDSDELGDVFFYAYTLQRLLGGPVPVMELPDRSYLWAASGEVAELIKKHLFHGADITPARIRLEAMISYLNIDAYEMHKTPEEIMSENIAKLRARHPDGWSADYADGGVK